MEALPLAHRLLLAAVVVCGPVAGWAQQAREPADAVVHRRAVEGVLQAGGVRGLSSLRDAARGAAARAAAVAMPGAVLRDVDVEPDRITLAFGALRDPSSLGTAGFEDALNAVLSAAGEAVLPEMRDLEFDVTFDGVRLDTLLERRRVPRESGIPASPLSSTPLIAVSPGHGWYWTGSEWALQRSEYWGIVEDLVTRDLAIGVETRLAAGGASVLPLREPDKAAGAGVSGHPRWQEAARYYLESIGAPSSVWNPPGYSSQRDQDIVCRPFHANSSGANILVSVHTNGGGGTGTETWYDTTNGHANASYQLASAIHNAVVSNIRANYDASWVDRGVKGAPGSYGEIREATRPAALVEVAFHDRQAPDNAALQSEAFRAIVSRAIADAAAAFAGMAADTATVFVRATDNGATWAGSLSYDVAGPAGTSGTAVPFDLSGPPGTYSVTYAGGGPEGHEFTGITPSSVQTIVAGSSATFTLNFSSGEAAPANDDCANAVRLTSATSCAPLLGTVQDATASGVAKPSCDRAGAPNLFDVWYRFTAVSPAHAVVVDPSTALGDPVVAVYAACDGALLACADTTPGTTETLALSGLAAGSTYYVRVYDWGAVEPRGVEAEFGLCVTHPEGDYRTLTIDAGGNGQGTVTGAGIDCTVNVGSTSGTCRAVYPAGTSVTLTAVPFGGSIFTGWSGSCAGAGACSVVMTTDAGVVATFMVPSEGPRRRAVRH